MSMLSDQVKKLREYAKGYEDNPCNKTILDTDKILRQAADTIETLSAKVANTEQLDRYYNSGWITCDDRLPEDGVDVLVCFEYFRYGRYNRLFRTIGISYTYNGKWSGFVNGTSGWDQLTIFAWMPLPKLYRQ